MIGKNKKAQSLANFLLVFLTLSIVATSLIYIAIKENNYSGEFDSPYALDSVYSREEVINFYLQDIFEHAALGVKDKQELINNITLLAGKYKIASGYVKNSEGEDVLADENVAVVLASIENLKEEDIELVIKNNKTERIKINFDVSVNYNRGSDYVKYRYNKGFETYVSDLELES